jgi:pyruvate kinase
MMDRIVRAAESSDVMPSHIIRAADARPRGYPAAVTHAARVLAEDLDASAILGMTRSGLTAEMLSRERARVPIYAFTPDAAVSRRLALWWGVTPLLVPFQRTTEAMIGYLDRELIRRSLARPGDTVVVVGSVPLIARGRRNFVQLHRLGSVRRAGEDSNMLRRSREAEVTRR